MFSAPPDRQLWSERIAKIARDNEIPPPAIDLAPLPEVDWVAESLKGLPPVQAGRFFVHGRHDAGRLPFGCLPLQIDAGLAFGTGRHETTLGCLLALDRMWRRYRFRRILDLGCGSGVLGLAAARLWPSQVTASDIDPQAVRTARANARLNDLGPRLRTHCGDGLEGRSLRCRGPFDLVLANILSGPLLRLAPAIAAATRRNAVVVLSGILTKQERQVLNTYRSFGFVLIDRIRLGEWPTLILQRPRRRSVRPGR